MVLETLARVAVLLIRKCQLLAKRRLCNIRHVKLEMSLEFLPGQFKVNDQQEAQRHAIHELKLGGNIPMI